MEEKTDENVQENVSTNSEVNNDGANYDFNFENKTQNNEVIIDAPEPPEVQLNKVEQTGTVADPSIGQINPNPVKPENVVPVNIDTAAGMEAIKKPVTLEPPKEAAPVNEIKTSGTATEEEIVIDATKVNSEVLDEFAINMDANAEKARQKKNNIFIMVVFGIIILFVALLRVIISIVGY